MGMLSDLFGGGAASSPALEASLAQSKENLGANVDALNAAQYRYQELEKVFGPIQKNLGDYYASLDPAKFETQMKTSVSDAYTNASKRLTETLAARGIQGGGVEAAARGQLEENRALGMASAGIEAPRMVAEQQAGYMQNIAMPQQTTTLSAMNASQSNVNQASAGVTNAYGNMAQWELSQQQRQDKALGELGAGIGEVGMTYLTGGFDQLVKPGVAT